jgi:haloalkane dehalogenase
MEPIATRLSLPSIPLTTRVLRSGEGPPVLLLHGSPDSATEWVPLMRALGDSCACVAPDLPGLGACDEPPASFDFSRQAMEGFVDGVLDAAGITEPVVVVVHDIGGVVGVPWAAHRPDRVRGVVITNTVAFERFPWFAVARLWSQRSALGKARAELGMRALSLLGGRVFGRWYQRVSPELSADDVARVVREFALDGKSKRSTLRLFRQMVPWSYFDGVDAMVRELIERKPVRVVWGEGDPYISASYARRFAGAPLQLLPRAGHWVPISAADTVAQAVREVLAAGRAPAAVRATSA